MQRRHGRLFVKQQSSAWGLTVLLLVALLGVSLVSEPGRTDTGKARAEVAPAQVDAGLAFADKAYAVSVSDGDEPTLSHVGDGQDEDARTAFKKADGP